MEKLLLKATPSKRAYLLYDILIEQEDVYSAMLDIINETGNNDKAFLVREFLRRMLELIGD